MRPGAGEESLPLRMQIIDRESFASGMSEQRARLSAALRDGMPRAGWKVGINVPEVQSSLGLRHPGIGWIDGRRVLASGAVLEAPPGARLHLEPELAIRLGRGVAAGDSPAAARAAILAIHPALEVVDYAKPADGLDAIVSHSMFHAGAVLGAPGAIAETIDLGGRWPELEVAGVSGGFPRRDLVPADLGELIAFVASYLAAFDERLEAGDIVLSGSFLDRAMRIRAGEEATARFGTLGEVRVRVAAAEATRR